MLKKLFIDSIIETVWVIESEKNNWVFDRTAL